MTFFVIDMQSHVTQFGDYKVPFVWSQPTAELDRSGDHVYTGVMAMVKQVVQLKNDVNTLPPSEYLNAVKVGFVFLCKGQSHNLFFTTVTGALIDMKKYDFKRM